MIDRTAIRQLLADLRGGGFTTSLLLDGITINGQKVVTIQDGLVFTVDAEGLVRATVINAINSVDF